MDFKPEQFCVTRDGRTAMVVSVGLDGVTVTTDRGDLWRVLPSGRARQGGTPSPNDIVSIDGAGATVAASDTAPDVRPLVVGCTGVTRDGLEVTVVAARGDMADWRGTNGSLIETFDNGMAYSDGKHSRHDVINIKFPHAGIRRDVPEAVRLTLRALLAAEAITPAQHQAALASFLL